MDRDRDIIAIWLARYILPNEAVVRTWLARHWRHAIGTDDVIQEAYCRIARLGSVDHIDNPRGYFQRTVQAVVIDTLRRSGINNIVSMTDNDWFDVIDSDPLADRALEAS